MKTGRPLRFLGVSLGGWAAARVVLLWPVADTLAAVEQLIGAPIAAAAMLALAPAAEVARPDRRAPPARRAVPMLEARPAQRPTPAAAPIVAEPPPTPMLPPPLRPTPLAKSPSRFAASAWTIVSGGSGGTNSSGEQLGGSQLGARLTYALGSARRIALTARLTAPLRGTGREAAVGIDWQPTAAAVHLIVEHRWSLDGARGGPTALIVAGIGPTGIAPGIHAEAYGQAGAIARDRIDGFADGAARLTTHLATIGATRIDIGAGAWGAVQRGAARVDIGPSIAVALPVRDPPLRLAIDWRQRIAGNARPGSGPALSIGSDF